MRMRGGIGSRCSNARHGQAASALLHLMIGLVLSGMYASGQTLDDDDCRKNGPLKCGLVYVPNDNMFFPSGVLELSSFTGLCSDECRLYLSNSESCKSDSEYQKKMKAICRSYSCSAMIQKNCGASIREGDLSFPLACSSGCSRAMNVVACQSTEELLPAFEAYQEIVGPNGTQCLPDPAQSPSDPATPAAPIQTDWMVPDPIVVSAEPIQTQPPAVPGPTQPTEPIPTQPPAVPDPTQRAEPIQTQPPAVPDPTQRAEPIQTQPPAVPDPTQRAELIQTQPPAVPDPTQRAEPIQTQRAEPIQTQPPAVPDPTQRAEPIEPVVPDPTLSAVPEDKPDVQQSTMRPTDIEGPDDITEVIPQNSASTSSSNITDEITESFDDVNWGIVFGVVGAIAGGIIIFLGCMGAVMTHGMKETMANSRV